MTNHKKSGAHLSCHRLYESSHTYLAVGCFIFDMQPPLRGIDLELSQDSKPEIGGREQRQPVCRYDFVQAFDRRARFKWKAWSRILMSQTKDSRKLTKIFARFDQDGTQGKEAPVRISSICAEQSSTQRFCTTKSLYSSKLPGVTA